MIRLVAVGFVVALALPAQAMPRAAIQQPDSLVITVREACGASMHRVNGVCVRTPARRQAARCGGITLRQRPLHPITRNLGEAYL